MYTPPFLPIFHPMLCANAWADNFISNACVFGQRRRPETHLHVLAYYSSCAVTTEKIKVTKSITHLLSFVLLIKAIAFAMLTRTLPWPSCYTS